jgi:hypothetical protein
LDEAELEREDEAEAACCWGKWSAAEAMASSRTEEEAA